MFLFPIELRRVAVSAIALLAMCVLLLAVPLRAQRPLAQMHHAAWSDLDGLPLAAIERIYRTPDGYLWLGGEGPLVRFDGVRFTRFDGNTTAAFASAVPGGLIPLLLDRDGSLWISRADGALVRYRDGAFHVAVRARGSRRRVHYLARDGAGQLWAMCGNGQGLQRVVGDSLVPAELPSWLDRREMVGVIADTGVGIWVGSRSQGLVHLTPRGAERVEHPASSGSIGARPLLQSRDGALWVYGDGLQILRNGTWQTQRMPDGGPISPPAASEGEDGAIWVATRGRGVLRFTGATMEQFTESHGLSDAVVTAVVPDAEGSVWIATEAGLDRLRRAPFSLVGPTQGLPFDSPSWITTDARGALWALSRTDLTLYQVDGGPVRDQPGPLAASALRNPPGSRFVPLGRTRDGGLWMVRLTDGRLARGTPDRIITFDPGSDLGLNAVEAVEDRHGSLWVMNGTSRLLRRVSTTTGREIAMPVGLDTGGVLGISEDARGHIVVSRLHAPFLSFLDRGRLVRELGPADGLQRPVIGLVAEGPDTLWGLHRDSALVRIVGSRVSVVHSADIAELLRGSSVAVLPAGDRLFIASTAGIASVERSAVNAAADGRAPPPDVRRYSALDGLPAGRLTAINRSPVTLGADGRIWFSTPGGLAVFDQRDAVVNAIAPRVHIEEVLSGGRSLPLDAPVRVPAGRDRLEFRFTATALRVPERVKLEFRLDGVDEEWRPADEARRVTYTQLRPRSYAFRVRAWNEDGVPAQNEAILRVRVMPYWHQTWWFLVLSIMSGIVAVAAVAGYTLRARAERTAERVAARFEATLTERTRLAGELHDTLLQGFTGITLQLQALRQRMRTEPDKVEQELGRVLTVADHTLREARSMVWDMRAPELEGQDIVAALDEASRQALAAHIASGGAPVEVAVQFIGARARVSSTAETTALRIGREAVTNALRHSKASRIDVEIAFEPGALLVRITDDGVGFDVATTDPVKGVGHWGLVGMTERARRASGSVRVLSTPGAGTTIDLHLPIS